MIPARMSFGSQARWALGAVICIVAVGVALHRDADKPTPSPTLTVTAHHDRAPSPTSPRTIERTAPDAIDAPADDDRIDDDRSSARRQGALARARLRKARREARLRAKRYGTSTAMLDADGYAVPYDVWAEGERFATATPVDASELAQRLGGSRGSVSFWFQPQWNDGSQDDASFLELADGSVRLVKNVDFLRLEFVDEDGVEHGLGAPITDWKSGEWHQVAGSWDGHTVALYFDGGLVRQAEIDTPLVLPDGPRMLLGSDFPDYRPVAAGVVGGVRVNDRPLSADEVRKRFGGLDPHEDDD
jgi:hypothetical protein